MSKLYSYNDFRYYKNGSLQHSWGSSPAQKLREKEYNKAYYEAHKHDKWGVKASGDTISNDAQTSKESLPHQEISEVDTITSTHDSIKSSFIKNVAYRFSKKNQKAHDREWEEVEEITDENGKVTYENIARIIKYDNNAYKKPPIDWSIANLNSIKLEAMQVNPWDPDEDSGTHNNCMRCVLATELRKRGYTISAGRSDTGLNVFTTFERWFNMNVKMAPFGNGTTKYNGGVFESVDHFLNRQPANSSGVVSFNNGTHVVHWSKTKEGKLLLLESQHASRPGVKFAFNDINSYSKEYNCKIKNYDTAIRLDDKDPDFEEIAKDSAIRTSDRKKSKVRNKLTGEIVDTW